MDEWIHGRWEPDMCFEAATAPSSLGEEICEGLKLYGAEHMRLVLDECCKAALIRPPGNWIEALHLLVHLRNSLISRKILRIEIDEGMKSVAPLEEFCYLIGFR